MTAHPVPGVYRHYKNKHNYRVIGTARHTETGEHLVVYVQLYDAGQIFVRPVDQFMADVDHEDQLQPRFMRVGD